MLRKILFFCLLVTLFPAYTAPARAESREETLVRVEKYLNSLTTIVADFMQVAPDGSITTGKFYLKRPGKMRWQYNPPTPLLMVASSNELIYYDYELEQVSHIPVDSTLAGFLAQDTIDLSDSRLVIQEVQQNAGAVRISLARRGREDEGRLMLEFSDNPLLIRNMVVTDAQGQTTNVSLNNAKFGVKLENSLFEFKDPRTRRRT